VPHQGFSSAAVVLPLVSGLLGLEGNAVDRTLVFSPQFPPDWPGIRIENFKIGKARFDILYRREKNRIRVRINHQNALGYLLKFAPALSAGTLLKDMHLNEKSLSPDLAVKNQVLIPSVSTTVGEDTLIFDVRFEPTLEILPPEHLPRVGDSNRGLKIVSLEREGDLIRMEVEGLPGRKYCLKTLNTDKIVHLKGAELSGSSLEIRIPGEKKTDFIQHTIRIQLKK
jgi:hypothetical protein